jgi:hypothetical protein
MADHRVIIDVDSARALCLHLGFAPSDVDRASAPALAAMLVHRASRLIDTRR